MEKGITSFMDVCALLLCSILVGNRAAAKYPDAKGVPPQLLVGPVSMAIFLVRYGQMLLYYFLTSRQLKRYQRSINQLFSDTSAINLKWGWWLINGYAAIIIAATFLFFLMRIYPNRFDLLYAIMMAVATPYIYVTSFKGIMQPTLWQLKKDESKAELEEEIVETEALDKRMQEKSRVKAGMADARLEEIVKKINFAMDN